VRYYNDHVLPTKSRRAPFAQEARALTDLRNRLADVPSDQDGEALQQIIYDVGKEHEFENLRDWFKALYQVLLGQDAGPRFGNFVELYGVPETVALIDEALAAA